MENQPEDHVRYTVGRSPSGLWAVCEGGSEEPIALFEEKNDAVSYADQLAGSDPAAEVEVMD